MDESSESSYALLCRLQKMNHLLLSSLHHAANLPATFPSLIFLPCLLFTVVIEIEALLADISRETRNSSCVLCPLELLFPCMSSSCISKELMMDFVHQQHYCTRISEYKVKMAPIPQQYSL